jgi:hypothetical protein
MTHTFAMASASIVLAGSSSVSCRSISFRPGCSSETGATALGFWLACLALGGGSTLSAGMAILVPILVIGVPVAETLVSMSRRLVRRLEKGGEGMFGADGEHIHHRLISRGVTHGRAVTLLYGVGVLGAGAGLVSVFLTVQAAAILLLTLIAGAVIGITRLNYDEFALVRRGVLLQLYDVPVRSALFSVFFDLGLVVLSLYGAIVLTFGDWGSRRNGHCLRAPGDPADRDDRNVLLLGTYRGPWRNVKATDFLRSSAAVVAATVVAGLTCLVAIRNLPPPAFFAIQALILFVLVNGSRGWHALLARGKPSPRPTIGSPGEGASGNLPTVSDDPSSRFHRR